MAVDDAGIGNNVHVCLNKDWILDFVFTSHEANAQMMTRCSEFKESLLYISLSAFRRRKREVDLQQKRTCGSCDENGSVKPCFKIQFLLDTATNAY